MDLINSPYRKTANSFLLNPRPYSDKIQNYEKTIILNDITYKLDSCLITNYNSQKHAIAGITCNDTRYVYNGWNYEIINNKTCFLIKYHWDLRKNKNFCLDYNICNFSKKINTKDTCFNFTKGDRILIYVRDNTKQLSLSKSSLLTYDSIKRDIPIIINDIYQINKLKIEELKNQLLLFGITDVDNKTKDELIELLRKKMTINY